MLHQLAVVALLTSYFANAATLKENVPLPGEPTVPTLVSERSSRTGRVDVDVRSLFTVRDFVSSSPVAGRQIQVTLFPSETFVLNGTSVTGSLGGVWTWSGTIEGYPAGQARLTLNRGSLFGVIDTGRRHYTIITDAAGQQWVREDDASQYPRGEDEVFPREGRAVPSSSKASATKTLSGSRTLDVLVLYTALAATRYDMYSLVPNSAAGVNSAFANSDVANASLNIVGYHYASNFDESAVSGGITGSYMQSTLLPAMQDGTGAFSGLPTLRDNLNADLVVLIYDATYLNGACGAGHVLIDNAGEYDQAYSVMGDGCISAYNNLAHEIGHNLGGRHNSPTSVGTRMFAYSHGYVRDQLSPFFQTILSSAPCTLSDCDRINYYSSSGETYSGVPAGDSSAADMAKVMNGDGVYNPTIEVVADYETAGGSAPGAPGSVTVTNYLCYGANTASWVASSGTVGWYELELSTSSSYTSPFVIYRGSEPSLYFDVASTHYVRVKACNGNGCSSWSNGNTAATYYNGCV